MVLPRHKLRGLSLLNVSLVAVVLAIAITAYLLFFRKDTPAASATRPTFAVARGEVTASVSSSGTLQSSQTASPQFETSGTVTQILVKVGQVVAKGAAIAKVDPSAAERQLRIADQNQIAAANSVTAASESLDDAQDAAEAAEEASASPSPTPTNGQQAQSQNQNQGQSPEVAVSNAEASLARAKADKEQADQDVEGAQAAVDATTLKAPIAGTITAINGSVGSVTGGSSSSSGSGTGGSTSGQGSGTGASSTTTTSASGFVDISDLKSLQVAASFPEADAIKIKAGQSATVTLNAEPGTTLTATLASVSPTPTTTNGVVAYSATFSLAKIPANARIGQTANVTVQTAKAADALYVPSTAIATSGTTYTVTMADGSGTREVEVGVRGDSFTQITSGLNEGDQVELLQGAISGAANQNGQGRTGQLPGGGQFGNGQLPRVGAGGGNRGR
ncbi:HlyD family efflux transporter periplasmic adaptor subunit [Kribbella capetownensis]|uniref:HlyD family efflux transporter periplasmic adaptor subunit n=1 Tax=Kribbella capetownensis TaxID=1572659 RepID=A0A4R0JPD2_9ACTN|nr:HlyD family efflux transporter periplasmic adaptor subunit [Kribbella capetownensis]TCC47794.1 HlyD family efflux transporter periplasmic adaptor subunit [Kribbella capetownensis]